MASPNHSHYGKGYFADCSCNWISEPSGLNIVSSLGDNDPTRVAARRLGHDHVADEILKVLDEPA